MSGIDTTPEELTPEEFYETALGLAQAFVLEKDSENQKKLFETMVQEGGRALRDIGGEQTAEILKTAFIKAGCPQLVLYLALPIIKESLD